MQHYYKHVYQEEPKKLLKCGPFLLTTVLLEVSKMLHQGIFAFSTYFDNQDSDCSLQINTSEEWFQLGK